MCLIGFVPEFLLISAEVYVSVGSLWWLAGLPAGWLVCCLPAWLGWAGLAGLPGWLAGWLPGRPAGWLTGCSECRTDRCVTYRPQAKQMETVFPPPRFPSQLFCMSPTQFVPQLSRSFSRSFSQLLLYRCRRTSASCRRGGGLLGSSRLPLQSQLPTRRSRKVLGLAVVAGWAADRLAGLLPACLAGWAGLGWLGWLAGWLAGCLAGRPAG